MLTPSCIINYSYSYYLTRIAHNYTRIRICIWTIIVIPEAGR